MGFEWLKDLDWKSLKLHKTSTDMFVHYNVDCLIGKIGQVSTRHKRTAQGEWYTETHFGVEPEYQKYGLGGKVLLAAAKRLGKLSIVKGRIINSNVLKVVERLKNVPGVIVQDEDWRYTIELENIHKNKKFELLHTTFEGFVNSPDQKLGEFSDRIKKMLDDALQTDSKTTIGSTEANVMASVETEGGAVTIAVNIALKDFTGDSPSPQLVQVVGRMYDTEGELFNNKTWDVDPSMIDGSSIDGWMEELSSGEPDEIMQAEPDAEEAGVDGGGEELDLTKLENYGNATYVGYNFVFDDGRKVPVEYGIRGRIRVEAKVIDNMVEFNIEIHANKPPAKVNIKS